MRHKTARTSDTIGSRSRITSCYHLSDPAERCEVSDWDAAAVSDVAVVQASAGASLLVWR